METVLQMLLNFFEGGCKAQSKLLFKKEGEIIIFYFSHFTETNYILLLSIVSDNHRRLVTCTALRYFGNNDVWNFIWDEFHQSNDTMERLDLIAAMGCITNVPALTR